jgi:hypothetical protein
MLMQTAVDHQEDLATRHLSIDHSRHVDAGLAHEVAPELDDDRDPAAGWPCAGSGQMRPDRRKIERASPGNKEFQTASEIQPDHGRRREG